MTRTRHDKGNLHQQFSLTLDGQGRVVHFDAQGDEILGYDSDDLASGLNFLDLFANEDRQRARDSIRLILKGQRLCLSQYTLLDKSGRSFPVLMNGCKDEPADGLRWTIFLMPENTAFAALIADPHSIFQIVLETIPVGICVVDARGTITHWNCAAERLTGISRNQAVGQRNDSIFNYRDQGAYRHNGPEAPPYEEIELIHNGRPVHLRKTVNFIHAQDGTISGAIESFVDMTAQFEAETALNEARELAESARTAKRHFLANMTHEIRTPLNGIIGLLDLLLNDQPSAAQRDNLTHARRSAMLLLDLFDNILDFTVVDKKAVNVEFTGFSLSSVITSVISRQFDLKQNQALAIHSHIDADVPDTLMGDAGRIYQILKQIVDNAIKFTPAGEVAIGVTRVPHKPHASPDDARRIMLHFSITDTGVGIAEKQLDAIFEAMTQADESSTRAFGGLGIGLTRVHRIVDLLAGRIWIESKPEQGTTVHVILPFKDATAVEGAEPGRANLQVHAGMNDTTGHPEPPLRLAPLPLTKGWHAQFKGLETGLSREGAEAETIIKHLKTLAGQANQKSVEKLLFRLLLAVRRSDRKNIRNYYSMIANKIALDENAGTIKLPEGERHENIDRRR